MYDTLTFDRPSGMLTFDKFDEDGDLAIRHLSKNDNEDVTYWLDEKEVRELITFLQNKIKERK